MKRSSIFIIFLVIIAAIFGAFFIHPDYLGKFRPWRLGLDLVGGSHLVYNVDMSEVPLTDRDLVMAGLRDVIERRVNLFGVSEPQVLSAKSENSYRLIVDIAGVKDIKAAINQIGETPFLVFSEINDSAISEQNLDDTGNPLQGQELNIDINDIWIPTELTGRYIKSAQVEFDEYTRQPQISLIFSDEGAKIFESLTEKNIGKQVAVFLDGSPITAPVVNGKITGGRAQITGSFTVEEARTLVERFNAGALPAPITQLSQQTIGASLGEDSLKNTILAGLIGTLLVILFMIFYYGRLGIFASIALIIYSILTLAFFKTLAITMTLAGIAGIVLSVGMAVDANILIFERAKEEIKKGGSLKIAISEGFNRAWPSIRDSNLTTIITALILYSFTSSFVKGFALALLLGVLVSMFSAITITRNLLKIFIKDKPIKTN